MPAKKVAPIARRKAPASPRPSPPAMADVPAAAAIATPAATLPIVGIGASEPSFRSMGRRAANTAATASAWPSANASRS